MSAITLNMPRELEGRIRERAARSGRDVESYLLQFLADEVPAEAPETRTDENEDDAPWRGVFALNFPKPELFQQMIAMNTGDLPRWKPTVHFDSRWVSDDE